MTDVMGKRMAALTRSRVRATPSAILTRGLVRLHTHTHTHSVNVRVQHCKACSKARLSAP